VCWRGDAVSRGGGGVTSVVGGGVAGLCSGGLGVKVSVNVS
jgi:hypothetical protein